MALSRVEIEDALHQLGLADREVLVHSSLSSFGDVAGGAATVLDALQRVCSTILLPAFTYECETWDERGLRPGNAYYERPAEGTRGAAQFSAITPVSREIGVIPETLRSRPGVLRSGHPLQSFFALGAAAGALIGPHDGAYPLAPIRRLLERDGWLLLLGVSHTSSTAIHLAEHLEGRRPFTRYARIPAGVVEVEMCGCSDAFDDLDPHVEHLERSIGLGAARHGAYPLGEYVAAARRLIRDDPDALLCGQCARCRARWVD